MKQRTVYVLSISFFLTLLVWGVYALLSYLGAPSHLLALLSSAGQDAVTNSPCAPGHYACLGFQALVPFIVTLFARLGDIAGYVVVSLVLYGAYVGVRWLSTQSWRLSLTLRPWHLVLLFLAATWVLFTVISMGSDSGNPLRRLGEPTAQLYQGASPEALQALQVNFTGLQDRGCLTAIGQTTAGDKLYDMSEGCVQESFVMRVLPPMLGVLLLLFELLVLGRGVLRLLRLQSSSVLAEAAVSAGLGTFCLIGLLWLLAIAGIYVQLAGWALLLLIPALLYRQSRYWIQTFLSHGWVVEVEAYSMTVLLGWILVSYLALNFLTVVRPFPIGWDDLGSYMNRPRLLVSYGTFIAAMASFQWEYITSLGFLLFGYNSYFGATLSMMFNWSEGLIALLAIYAFGRTWLGRNRGLLAALLYYTLPMIGHFSFADMKIDNAEFAIGALATFALFQAFFPVQSGGEELSERDRRVWLAIAGGLTGLAFGIKVTAAMLLMTLGALLVGLTLGPLSFLSAVFFALAVFAYKGVLNVGAIGERIAAVSIPPISTSLFLWVCIVLGLALLFPTVRNWGKWKVFLVSLGFFVLGFVVSVAPWIEYNNIQLGNVIPQLALGLPDKFTPVLDLTGTATGANVRSLPKNLAVDTQNPACKPSGSAEELDRYWGFDKGWGHYIALPWRTVLNLDSSGYYVMTSFALLLLPLLLLLPYFWTKQARWLRWLTAATAFLIVQWVFLANGVPWYGIAMCLGLVVALEALVARAPDVPSRVLASTLIGLSLMSVISLRLWQWEQQRNLFEYPMGKISADALKERTIQHYDAISATIVQRHASMPDRPYLYRMGTFIPYFIPKNLEIIGIGDQQLDLFHCLNQEGNHALTLQRLDALGFNSMIFDTNTQTIESDPNGSLHRKVQEFLDFANDPALHLQIVVNDPNAGVAFLLLP